MAWRWNPVCRLRYATTAQPYLEVNRSTTRAKQFHTASTLHLPSKHTVLPDVPPLFPSNSLCRTFQFTSSASLHQYSHDAAFVPYGVASQTEDSAAALTRWPFLPSSRRAAFEGIVAASSLFKNRIVMAAMTIRQARVIRPSMLKPTITTFVSPFILDAVQMFCC